MTLTLDLTPEEERRIQGAKAKGIDVHALLKGVIASLPQAPAEDRTEELFAQWEAEDANMTPEEIAAEMADWEAFKHNVNAIRAETGERQIYQ
jgi:hypothetical protein